MKTTYEQSPEMKVIDNENGINVFLFLPGVKKENIKIEATDGETIDISATRDGNSLGRVVYGYDRLQDVKFSKRLKLSSRLDSNSITPKYELGVLQLSINEKEKAPPKEITF